MNTQVLTLDDLRQRVPSAFATQAHSSRSERYAYIPTINVIEGLMANGFLPVLASESRYRDASKAGFTKHLIRFRNRNAEAIVGDTFFEVAMVNSHDGSSAYDLSAGLFRFTCKNGAFVAEGTIASVHVRHTGKAVEEVVAGAQQVLDGAPRVIEAVNRWNGLMLTDGEQKAFADSARILRFGDAEGNVDTPITSEQLLRPRRYDDNGRDLWHTFNRVQENTIKGHLSAYGRDNLNRARRVTTREVKGIDQDVKLNRALWSLAERMAELKQAV